MHDVFLSAQCVGLRSLTNQFYMYMYPPLFCQITAEIKGCSGDKITAKDNIKVLVDANLCSPEDLSLVPPSSCRFGKGPDLEPKLDISRALESCAGIFFQSSDLAKDCVERAVTASDAAGGCRNVHVDVEEPSQSADHSNCNPLFDISVRPPPSLNHLVSPSYLKV